MAIEQTTRSDSVLQGVTTLWKVAYEGVVRDSFWSPHVDPDKAHAEYCDARHWLRRDRVAVL